MALVKEDTNPRGQDTVPPIMDLVLLYFLIPLVSCFCVVARNKHQQPEMVRKDC